MRRLVGWMAGLAGIAALAKILRRRQHPKPGAQPGLPVDDPAEELRRKLAEARAGATPPVAAPDEPTDGQRVPETGAPGDGETAPTIAERRADVHARAQAAIDAMRQTTE